MFWDIIGKFVEVFIDDLAVHSKPEEDHEAHVQEVLIRLARSGLMIALKKCKFFQSSVLYLGHIISSSGIQPDPSNVAVIKSWKKLDNRKQVKSFLGAVSYYRRFIERFSERCIHLRALITAKSSWTWDKEQKEEFEDLKKALTSYPILRYFDPMLETRLKTDSSQHTVGSVLAQCVEGIEHVVAYASQSFTPQELRWAIPHKECYAIVWAIKKFTKYLDGHHFGVYTDHHSSCSLFKIRDPHGKLAHWAITLITLQEYDFHIIFKTGSCNADADCLSQLPT